MPPVRRKVGPLTGFLLMAACVPAGHSGSGGELRYSEMIMAPDACYRVAPEPVVERVADRLVVRRRVSRLPGLCAQVMSPLEISGTIEDDQAFSEVVLEVIGPNGAQWHRVLLKARAQK